MHARGGPPWTSLNCTAGRLMPPEGSSPESTKTSGGTNNQARLWAGRPVADGKGVLYLGVLGVRTLWTGRCSVQFRCPDSAGGSWCWLRPVAGGWCRSAWRAVGGGEQVGSDSDQLRYSFQSGGGLDDAPPVLIIGQALAEVAEQECGALDADQVS